MTGYLTTGQVMKLLDRSRNKVIGMVKRGELNCERFDWCGPRGARVFRRGEVEGLLGVG